MNAKSESLREYFSELEKRTSGQVRTDNYSRIFYSTDASLYQVMPYGVLIPRQIEEVHAAVELAAKYSIPILPRTGGSSLAGQAINEAVIIDMSPHLNQILEINQEEKWVRVQPGLVLDELNIQLQQYGLQFGPDPASGNRAAMGGIVANNSTGAHSILYGMTADHVLETNVVLSDGLKASFKALDKSGLEAAKRRSGLEAHIYRTISKITQNKKDVIQKGTPKHWRRCGGYNLDRFVSSGINFNYPQDERFNLAKLICGSEGTLAVMTDIKLNLVPLPKLTGLALLQFDDLYQALDAVQVILQTNPSAVELLDSLSLKQCQQVPEYARLAATFLEGNPFCLLITEFYGESESELESKIQRLKDHLQKSGIHCRVVTAINPELQNNVWTVRKEGLGFLMSVKGDYKPIPLIEDAAVPVEYLAEYISKIEKFCNDLGTQIIYYAHASAGCLHVRPLINTKIGSEILKMSQISEFAAEIIGGYGGALSSEHGDGRSRSWLTERFFGNELYGLFKEVKTAFDPANILNPGNIVDPQQVSQNLRYGDSYSTVQLQEHLDFSENQGFDRAIEMCNGSGVCRKTTSGTMCPSYMATKEEEHSTRGRANALRAALSGRLPFKEFTSKRMYDVLDLCIECKGCKAECPSSVDMAKIKFEFLSHYYEANRAPLRSKLFGNIATINRLVGGEMALLINWLNRNPLLKWSLEKFLGISRKRELPAFARRSFLNWFQNRRNKQNNSKQEVVLFNDTFNTYNDPQIAIAAVEILEAAGFSVKLAGIKCCGRPMISKGLIDSARAAARDTVEKLLPFAERGIPIVGLEPSCILSLRDEYLSLLSKESGVKSVANYVFTFEEFFANLAGEGKPNLQFTDERRNILLHGHCHQKALVGTKPAHTVLSLPPNYSVTEVDSGCCGMAGSFGYEKEHYGISMAMAERRLLPAVRKADESTIIAAAGTSCRHQILHGAGRRVLHPVEILRNALVSSRD
jgi:FAD/FMN-containing dehydrogenase/Fe-S oxidoreductase